MITIENSYLADKSTGDVYGLFSQIEKLAWAFPTTNRVEVIDDDHVNLGVLLKLGLLPLDNNLTLEVIERKPPLRLVAEGVALPGKGLARAAKIADKDGLTRITMILDLEEVGPGQCRICYRILADAQGNLKRVYEAIIKGQRAKLESQFIKNVAELLGAPIAQENGAAKAAT